MRWYLINMKYCYIVEWAILNLVKNDVSKMRLKGILKSIFVRVIIEY